MLKHGLKFLRLSKITARFCQHCGGSQLVLGLSAKTCLEMRESRGRDRDAWPGRPVLRPGLATATSELCSICQPSVPSRAAESCPAFQGEGSFGENEAWWRRRRRKEQRGFIVAGWWGVFHSTTVLGLGVSWSRNNLYSSVSSCAFSRRFA